MDYNERWDITDDLGGGGQGKVYKVANKNRDNILSSLPNIIESISDRGSGNDRRVMNSQRFRDLIINIIENESPEKYGALKVLHQPDDTRDFANAEERLRREIEAMRNLDHPNLLKIVDVDDDLMWYVSEYHSLGTLDKNLDTYKGDIMKSLKSFRPLVESLAKIHSEGYIHRDIKPMNIFINLQNHLVLGDFGLVYFADEEHTRISDTYQNVGSRDWMPLWAQGVRIEEIDSKFDLFCLGKVLWSMVSGEPFLRAWYFEREEFNLEIKFPENRFMKLINDLLSKCVVENQEDCILNADSLVEEILKIESIINNNSYLIDQTADLYCTVCGLGKYRCIVDRDAIILGAVLDNRERLS